MLFSNHFRREIDLILSSENKSGWFHSLPDPTPNLYTTHYFLKIREKLDLEVYNSRFISDLIFECLTSQFTTEKINFSSTSKRIYLRDYYDTVSILQMIGDDVSDHAITSGLNRLNRDGQYVLWADRDGNSTGESNILALYFASFLHSCSNTLDSSNIIESLHYEWADSESSEYNKKALVVASLSLLESDISKLNQIGDWKKDYINYINTVSSGGLFGPDLSVLAKLCEDASLGFVKKINLNLQSLEDGGYSVDGRNYSDSYVTSSYVTIVRETSGELCVKEISNFLKKYQLPTGGYQTIISKEPTIKETYYARRALSLFSKTVNLGEIPNNILQNINSSKSIPSVELLYMLYNIVRDSMGEPENEVLRQLLRQQSFHEFKTIESIYKYFFLCENTDGIVSKNEVRKLVSQMYEDPLTGLPSWEEWYFALKLEEEFNVDVDLDRSKLTTTLENNWCDYGGFSPLHSNQISQPIIHSTYYCTQILEILDKQVPDTGSMLSFINKHRSLSGCFCPNISSDSKNKINIISTYQCLYMINSILS